MKTRVTVILWGLECLCTSVAAYAYKCCQEGVSYGSLRSSTCCSTLIRASSLGGTLMRRFMLSYLGNDTVELMELKFNMSKFYILLTRYINCSIAKGLIKETEVSFSVLCLTNTVAFELGQICTILGEIVYNSLMAMKFHCSSDKKHCFKNIILNLYSDLTF